VVGHAPSRDDERGEREAVSGHDPFDGLRPAWRSRWIAGSATFTTKKSRTIRNTPAIRTGSADQRVVVVVRSIKPSSVTRREARRATKRRLGQI
jgi:hypothetical protein